MIKGTKIIGYKEVSDKQKKEAKIQIELLKHSKPMPQEIKDKINKRKENYNKIYNSNLPCPNCNNKLVPIIYGLIDSDIMEQFKRKEIYYGGCEEIITNHAYEWFCYKCNYSYTKDLKHNDHEKTKKD